jgi:Kef-type K+ transport system membrane component KefB
MPEKLYLINFSFLITHEIDSAFWHEWEMFQLPGGIQFFNIINFLLILFFMFGISEVVKKTKRGFVYAIVLSIVGVTTFFIHSIFILMGYEQFLLPVSIVILFSCFFISVWLLIQTIKDKNIFARNRIVLK